MGEVCHYLQEGNVLDISHAVLPAKQQASIKPDKMSYSFYRLYN